ncbi:MAG: hydroxyacylglutathione hydrolase [Pseudomonadota bacterium]|nr:hydroxyacylglutathione hydrolase [Pseudomonadota bacterium]
MTPFEIIVVPALSDNYIYIAHDTSNKTTLVVDPSEATPVLNALKTRGWTLTHILNTHHHGDHIGGNKELIDKFNPTLIGPLSEESRIPNMHKMVKEGDKINVGGHEGLVFETPGHTHGHIAVWFKDSDALFCGDTLFALGCGRVFEGTMEQMWDSLKKLRSLPISTKIYCGHEYTLSNAKFAQDIDPKNAALQKRIRKFEAMRADGLPTIPTLLADELGTNPFLRADDASFAEGLGLNTKDPVAIFTETRSRKDNF